MKNLIFLFAFLFIGTTAFGQFKNYPKTKTKVKKVNPKLNLNVKNHIIVLPTKTNAKKLKTFKKNGQTYSSKSTVDNKLNRNAAVQLNGKKMSEKGFSLISTAMVDGGNGLISFYNPNDYISLVFNQSRRNGAIPAAGLYLIEIKYVERLGSHGRTAVRISNSHNHSRNVMSLDLNGNDTIRVVSQFPDRTYITMDEGRFLIDWIKVTPLR